MNEHAKKAFAFIEKHKWEIEDYKGRFCWPYTDKWAIDEENIIMPRENNLIVKAAIEIYDDDMGLYERLTSPESYRYNVKSLSFAELEGNAITYGDRDVE